MSARKARSQQLSCDIHTAWTFFSIPANLSTITSPDMKLTTGSDISDQQVYEGPRCGAEEFGEAIRLPARTLDRLFKS